MYLIFPGSECEHTNRLFISVQFFHFCCRIKQGKRLSEFLQKYTDSGTKTTNLAGYKNLCGPSSTFHRKTLCQFVMLYLVWDREINISLFFSDVLYENEAPCLEQAAVVTMATSAATFKKGFFCLPPQLTNFYNWPFSMTYVRYPSSNFSHSNDVFGFLNPCSSKERKVQDNLFLVVKKWETKMSEDLITFNNRSILPPLALR